MKVIDTIHRPPVTTAPETTVTEVAALMESTGVGTVVVVDHGEVAGIVTDRDLVRRVLATGLMADVRIDSVMSMPVVTIDGELDLHSAYGMFRDHAVRRLVVTRFGELAGIIAIDDLFVYLAADLTALSTPLTAEILFGHHDTHVPALSTTSTVEKSKAS